MKGEYWTALSRLRSRDTYHHWKFSGLLYIYRIAKIFRQEKVFASFATCLHGRNFYPANFLSRTDDYTEDMVTFTAMAKFYSCEYFCNARVAGIGEIFFQRKVSAIQWYLY